MCRLLAPDLHVVGGGQWRTRSKETRTKDRAGSEVAELAAKVAGSRERKPKPKGTDYVSHFEAKNDG